MEKILYNFKGLTDMQKILGLSFDGRLHSGISLS